MSMNRIKFGTGGFRGIIGEDFSKETVTIVASALSRIMLEEDSKKEIVIGFDRRNKSPEAALDMALVFTYYGIKVFLANKDVPTPCIIYHTMAKKEDYGIMITASHNPANFNGVKVFTKGGYDADEEFTSRLEQKCQEIKNIYSLGLGEAKGKGLLAEFDALTPYIDFILPFSKKHLTHDLKIAYDNLNGVGINSIEPILKKIGVKTLSILNPEHDITFKGKLPNPIEKNLKDLSSFVTNNKYDVGFSADSDADRLGVIDEKGNFVTANEILACIYYYLVKVKGLKGDIVKNCATSMLLDDLANKLGYKCHEVDVGFKNITRKMDECNALLGGESSGGLTCRNYLKGKDTTFALVLFVNMMDDINKPVSEIVKEVKEFASFKSFDYETFLNYPPSKEKMIKEYLENNSPDFVRPFIKKEIIDRNYRYFFSPSEWCLLRLSNTEPALRLYLEIDDPNLLKEEENRIAAYIKKLGE